MSQIAPFRLTAEDLPDLDRKTQAGLTPLLEALNTTLQQVVAAVSAAPAEQLVSVALQTDAVVADSFPLVFKTEVPQPRFVAMVCVPKDVNHTLATAFVMQGFSLTDGGLVSVPFITGLLAENAYSLTFLVR